MDSQMQSLVEWATSTPVGAGIIALVSAGFLAAALYFRRLGKGLRAAEEVMSTQYEPASKADVDALVEFAASLQKKDFVLHQLAGIRRDYGHEGLKRGHIFWLADVLSGRAELISPPPTFKGEGQAPSTEA